MNNSFYNPYAAQRYPAQRYGGYTGAPMPVTDSMPEHITPCEHKGESISPLPENAALAMAYVPFQTEIKTYDLSEAFKNGTLFPCLDKKFTGCCKYE